MATGQLTGLAELSGQQILRDKSYRPLLHVPRNGLALYINDVEQSMTTQAIASLRAKRSSFLV